MGHYLHQNYLRFFKRNLKIIISLIVTNIVSFLEHLALNSFIELKIARSNNFKRIKCNKYVKLSLEQVHVVIRGEERLDSIQ